MWSRLVVDGTMTANKKNLFDTLIQSVSYLQPLFSIMEEL